jgi:transcriptional regulator with XRE-family HTH domain
MDREKLNQWVVDQLNTNNMSMRELSRRSGINHSEISKILSGKQKAAFDFYIKVAQVFDDMQKMLVTAGILSQVEEDELTFWELYRAIKSLSREDRQHLNDYVDFLVEQDKKRKAAARNQKTDPATGHA